MFKIAICDDEQVICSQVDRVLSDYAETTTEKFQIEIFDAGTKLYDVLSQGVRFDLIFLDIEMEGVDGVELGRRIREEMRDEITHIVYISSKQKYALELFENRPLNFFIKPLQEADIHKVLKKALAFRAKQSLCFEFSWNRSLYRIAYNQILYFESADKKIILHTLDRKYEFYGGLYKVNEQLKTYGFVQIHKSYIINYTYIKEIHCNYVVTTRGVILHISKTFKKAALEQLFKLGKEW